MDRDTWRRLRSRLFEISFPVASRLIALLPWRWALALGRRLGALAWLLSRRDRGRTLEHLARAFPELGPARREALGRACFEHHTMNLVETLHALGRRPEEILERIEVAGWERVEEPLRAGRTLFVLTAHCGSWELLGAVFTGRGIPLTGVVRDLDPGAEKTMRRIRRHYGTRTIVRGSPGAVRELLRVFRSGGVLAMLNDQDVRVDGVWVPFFGRLAHTPTGAAEIALRRRAVVVPIFMERLEDGRHRMRCQPALELPDDVTGATAMMTAAIEAQVRRRPEQWVWMHRRWRRRPPGEEQGGDPASSSSRSGSGSARRRGRGRPLPR